MFILSKLPGHNNGVRSKDGRRLYASPGGIRPNDPREDALASAGYFLIIFLFVISINRLNIIIDNHKIVIFVNNDWHFIKICSPDLDLKSTFQITFQTLLGQYRVLIYQYWRREKQKGLRYFLIQYWKLLLVAISSRICWSSSSGNRPSNDGIKAEYLLESFINYNL